MFRFLFWGYMNYSWTFILHTFLNSKWTPSIALSFSWYFFALTILNQMVIFDKSFSFCWLWLLWNYYPPSFRSCRNILPVSLLQLDMLIGLFDHVVRGVVKSNIQIFFGNISQKGGGCWKNKDFPILIWEILKPNFSKCLN